MASTLFSPRLSPSLISPFLYLSLSLYVYISVSLTLSLSLCLSLSLSHSLSLYLFSLSLTLSVYLSLSISSLSFSFSVSLPICLSISQSLCLSLFTGDYPTSQSAQQNKSKAVKVGNLFWGPRTWAGVLNFVKFLHINVAGKDKNDLKIIEKIVKDLGISNQKKIRFNFNETIDRGAFSGASASRKAGER